MIRERFSFRREHRKTAHLNAKFDHLHGVQRQYQKADGRSQTIRAKHYRVESRALALLRLENISLDAFSQ